MTPRSHRSRRIKVGVFLEQHLRRELVNSLGTVKGVEIAELEPDGGLRPVRDCEVLVVGGRALNAVDLASLPGLRLIQKWGSGTDSIDVEAARQCGILVANTPGANSRHVAEHFWALVLACLRQIPYATESMRLGRWCQREVVERSARSLWGKRLGLVGMGTIGRIVAAQAAVFGMNVDYCSRQSPAVDDGRPGGPKHATLDQVAQADVVGICASYNSTTHHIVDAEFLGKMRTGAVLVNIARGALIDESALLSSLDARRCPSMVGLDVFEGEPHINGALVRHRSVISTPHIAGRTVEARMEINELCIRNINAFIEGREDDIVGRRFA